MPESLLDRFERLKAEQPPAAPPLTDVRRSARRLRRGRRTTGLVAALSMAVAVAGLAVQLGRGGPDRAPLTPAVTAPPPSTPTGPATSTGPGTPTGPASARGRVGALEMPSPPEPRSGATTTGFADFLRPGDLGPGWILDGAPTTSRFVVDTPQCARGQTLDLDVRQERLQAFARRTETSPGVWTAREYHLPLAVPDATRLRDHLDAVATCPLPSANGLQQRVVGTGNGILVTATVLPSGQVATVAGFAVTAQGYLILTAEAAPDQPLPGQAAWAVGFVRTAVERLTGATPPDVVIRDGLRTPDTSPAPRPGPRLLQQADLGTAARWTRPVAPVTRRDEVVSLPDCRANRADWRMVGPTVHGSNLLVQPYLGWDASGPDAALRDQWTLVERVVTLSPAEVTQVRAALARARRCTFVGAQDDPFTLAPLTRVDGDRLVAVSTVGGRLQWGTAWALSGRTLVMLRAARQDRQGGTPQPLLLSGGNGTPPLAVAPRWLDTLLTTAVRRAAG